MHSLDPVALAAELISIDSVNPSLVSGAAGEAAIGLAILVIYFRGRGTIAVDDVNRMKG